MFLFKKKKIVVDAFTKDTGIKELYPIESANTFLPQWWKNLPSSYDVQDTNGIKVARPTLKRCDGLTQNYRNGFIMPLWLDTTIKTTLDGKWAYRLASNDTETLIDSHSRNELGNEFDKLIHLKLHSPWLLEEKKGCEFYFTSPFWNHISQLGEFFIPPGTVNYKHQSSTNINFLLPKADRQITLHSGMPLVHIIPLTDTDVEIRCHQISAEEHHQLYMKNYLGSFLGSYKKNKKIRNKTSKCPLGF